MVCYPDFAPDPITVPITIPVAVCYPSEPRTSSTVTLTTAPTGVPNWPPASVIQAPGYSLFPPEKPLPVIVTSEAPRVVATLPSYEGADEPAPPYESLPEPTTLAKYLFKYGFLFPIFWIVGASILFSNLNPIPEAECGKSAAQQADELAILRRVELKWAWRSLYALLTLLAIIAMIFLVLFATHTGVFAR